MSKTCCLVMSLLACAAAWAQTSATDSADLPYAKMYALALDANVASILDTLKKPLLKPLTVKSQHLKEEFLTRFGEDRDRSDYLTSRKSVLDPLLEVYVQYWRKALLSPKENFDSVFKKDVANVLAKHLAMPTDIVKDSLDYFVKRMVAEAGYYTTGFGKTMRLYDLLIWKRQQDTTYVFKLKKEIITAPVALMDSFLTLGWEEYATFGRHYPAGWATEEKIFAVKEAYDLDSEKFRVSLLAHEGRHFSDYKQFPNLSGKDLEYRAKLAELMLAKATLYNLLEIFLARGKADSENPHPAANYLVMHHLSQAIFNKELESDVTKWKKVSKRKIAKAAFKLLQESSSRLANPSH